MGILAIFAGIGAMVMALVFSWGLCRWMFAAIAVVLIGDGMWLIVAGERADLRAQESTCAARGGVLLGHTTMVGKTYTHEYVCVKKDLLLMGKAT